VHSVDELIDGIVNSTQIPSGKLRGEIERELRSHLEDFIATARESGHDDGDIQKLVLAHFGDPRQIARGFAWVYRRERRTFQIVAHAFSTAFLACSLFAAILAAQTGLALGFGKPILNVLASRHTVIEGLDILASVAAYLGLILLEDLFQRHRFQKAAGLLASVATVLMTSSALLGWHTPFLAYGLVNGLFFRTVQRFVPPKAARVGIVLICFPLTGLIFALLRSPFSPVGVLITCSSWLIMGAGYQIMTDRAGQVDAAVLSGLRRIQSGC
jgi:hypothetical protein